MAAPAVTTVYEGNNILIKKILMDATVELATEVAVIDASALTGPDGTTGIRTSLLEASWSLDASFTGKVYVHDEGNDTIFLVMSGDGSFDGTGFGGLASRRLETRTSSLTWRLPMR